ncbi:hypothetical protein AC578_2832 [Pseudocercospora eumusae]|uniref:Amidase domain-containing protein n=1 Tax=Pseudocercospora eumusae TaxID=321146 RepID=A0A139H163_9PEZI|nr:hypothetical protein AC578_2832 [Pseudocercospora eumusae]
MSREARLRQKSHGAVFDDVCVSVHTSSASFIVKMHVLSIIAALISYLVIAQSTFDPREATISSTHHNLYTGLTTCQEVVSSFLSRIEALNHRTNAILALNPQALQIAQDYDSKLQANNGTYGPLFCIPILLKDNFDTSDMVTTGGSLSLAQSQPTVDAPSVVALKKAGAIILGKANLHELALEGISVSSLGGQTINPYDYTRTPGGSSGGSAAAVAASFAVFATGSDTVNSLRSPASANSLFSCRPTKGLISRTGIIPCSYTQDTIGPIGRNVKDIATALTVMASVGFDSEDNTTALAPAGIQGVDFTADLENGYLNGLRFGLLNGFMNHTSSPETDPVNKAMANVTARLEAAGASIVNITDKMYNTTDISNRLDTQIFELRENLNAYLERPSLHGQHPSTTNELFSSHDFLVLPSQHNYVKILLNSSTSNQSKPSYDSVRRGIEDLTLALAETLRSNNLDALIYPEQKNLVVKIGSPSQSGRNGILAALTGSPVVTVPVGFSKATENAPEGVPIGMEILGMPWTEGKLLQIAYQLEGVRRPPSWAKEVVPVKMYESVPGIMPDAGNVPRVYPIGVL